MFPVQALDGAGTGPQSLAAPGLAARILKGTGRVNVGQGAAKTVQEFNAYLGALGGLIAQELIYRALLLILGGSR